MPHIDELLGAATLVSAGMFAALSLQPMDRGAAETAAAHPRARAEFAAAPQSDAPIVCGTVEAAARRNPDAIGIGRKQASARDCAAESAPHAGA